MSPTVLGRDAGIIFACYLLGAIPFGFIAARLVGLDITRQGSGSTGATNVLRVIGPVYAVPVLLLDVGKGALAAYLGLRFLDLGTLGALIAGAAAISGHNWSVFLRFKGGKGVAASLGVVIVAFPVASAVALGSFVLIVAISRYVSLGSIFGAWTAVAFAFVQGYDWLYRIIILVLVSLITYQHRSNIGRLLQGKENKISFGAKPNRAKDGGAAGGPVQAKGRAAIGHAAFKKGGASR